jgi:hypothetical protein
METTAWHEPGLEDVWLKVLRLVYFEVVCPGRWDPRVQTALMFP